MTDAPDSVFGTVALVGRPNVGKSSLLNAILGSDLAMVSPKAQATRLPITGVFTRDHVQMVLRDLPGLLDPRYALQRSLRRLALDGLADADLVLHLHPASEAPAPPLASLVADAASAPRGPVLPVYTKADLAPTDVRTELEQAGALLVAHTEPATIAALLNAVAARLPTGPFRYDPEDIGTQPVRFFVGEYLREAAFGLLSDELPYAVTAEVEEFREDSDPVYIRATLFVERESQKGIVIGTGGQVLREIGSHARRRLETLLGARVYLETRVKVLSNWRRRSAALARFGFPPASDETD